MNFSIFFFFFFFGGGVRKINIFGDMKILWIFLRLSQNCTIAVISMLFRVFF